MNWFGLNWTDILLGTALLALVPFAFAAYGGQLATETITDPKRRHKIKLQFWGLFVIGVALGFYQQFRGAIADRDRQTQNTWADIVRQLSPRIYVPSFAYDSSADLRRKGGPDFTISQPRALINMNREFTASLPIWVRYSSGQGDTISPLAVALFVDITTHLPHQEKIQNYSVAVKTQQCGWTYLSPIRMQTTRAYWVYNGVQRAMPLDFSSNGLDYLLKNAIPPYGTVSGWLFFDTRVKCEIGLGEPIQYRISFDTFSGKKFEKVAASSVLSNTAMIPGKSQANMTGPTFVTLPGVEDLSKSYVKFYSDEVK